MAEEAEKHLNLEQRVKELERQVRSLKTRNTKLANRVQDIELLDFQQQITKLNERITKLDELTLGAEQHLAWVDINGLTTDFLAYLSQLNPLLGGITYAVRQTAREHALRDAAAFGQQVYNSTTPVDLAKQFRQNLVQYCAQTGINYFAG